MPTEFEQRTANAKSVVLSVLAGELTPENNQPAFDDDVVYISVRTVETREPEWLIQAIAEADPSSEGIRHVLECMAHLRERAEALISSSLRAEE
jgi:hypothetical protein